MRFTYRFSPLVLCTLLMACDMGHGGSTPNTETSVFGWRGTGLVLSDASNTGGLHRLTHVGNHIFAMDAYTPPGNDTVMPFRWRIWHGKVGSSHWDSLPMPNGNIPSEWTVIGDYLYIGAKYSGEVWRYDPPANQWRLIPIPNPAQGTSKSNWYDALMLGSFQGELVVGIAVMDTNTHYLWMGGVKDSIGHIIPGYGPRNNYPLDKIIEFNGYLYGIKEEDGLFRWKPGMTSWEHLPSPRGRNDSMTVDLCAAASTVAGYSGALSCPQTKANSEWEMSSAIGVHDGKLYVGYDSYSWGLYRMESDSKWTLMTPSVIYDSTKITEAPRDIRTIASINGRLYIAGVSYSTPKVWTPTNLASPAFGDWRNLPDGWCRTEYGCGTQTWGMIGIGDTLYATAWGYLAKVPISQVDSMAVLEYYKECYPKFLDTAKGTWKDSTSAALKRVGTAQTKPIKSK